MTTAGRRTTWTTVAPVAALVVLAASWHRAMPVVVATVVGIVLAAAVLAAVHHTEVIAHKVGEPYGSLVLAVAVTVIEVGLILSLTAAGGPSSRSLARDTVFAAVMITCNGILGLALLVGAVRRGLAVFNAEGSGAALATVATLSTVCLVLPTFTTSQPGPAYSGAQPTFAAVASLVLYGVFVATQTVRHRDFFLPATLARLRATPRTTRVRGDEVVVEGDVPGARVAAVREALPGLTGGQGLLESAFDRYEPVDGPPQRAGTGVDPFDRKAYLLRTQRRGLA